VDRKALVLPAVDISKGTGLEIGPLTNPIVRKDESRVLYVDHMTTKDLKTKYRGHPIELDDIVEVDYVLKNNSLKDTLEAKKFDYVVAAHVIEHIPDIVAWLKDVESVLKDKAVLALAIPDKRYTFDIARDESRPADVIGAYLDKHRRPSSAAMYDYMIEFVDGVDSGGAWQNPYTDYTKKRKNTPKTAYRACLENLDKNKYVDCHCFVFTPYSFFQVLRSLMELDLFGFEVAYFRDTPPGSLEFYVSLRKVKKNAAEKMKTLPKIKRPETKRELELKILSLQQELNMITGSKSWKVTKPLRHGVSSVKQAARNRPGHG
jgi:SAM-dependent methyltransferase